MNYMLDIHFFRHNQEFIVNNLLKRGVKIDYNLFFDCDFKIRKLKKEIYLLQREHNFTSFLIKYSYFNLFFLNYLTFKVKSLKHIILEKKNELTCLNEKLDLFLNGVPNLLHTSVVLGNSCLDNLEIKTFVNSKNSEVNFNTKLLNDLELNKNYLDFDLSAKISGAGFVFLKDSLAELHRAIGNYMLDKHVLVNGYKEIYSPVLVNSKSMYNSGHFPKFKDDQFEVVGSDFWLIPTAEVPLTNVMSNSIINFYDLPIKLVSKTLCFRKEKGNYGYLVKGMIRQHQFEKVELVNIVTPDKSYSALEELVFNVENILQELDLSYRVLSLCSMDIGFSSSKTYDLEVWLPKRKIYVEVSSCSNTESFQSRRMNSKFYYGSKLVYPHMLNGSGLAIGRILLAIMENYSDSLGNLVIPNVLIKYMNGKRIITY